MLSGLHKKEKPIFNICCPKILCGLQLTQRVIEVGSAQPQLVQWEAHEVQASSHFLEYIPGRDRLWPPADLAAGLILLKMVVHVQHFGIMCKTVDESGVVHGRLLSKSLQPGLSRTVLPDAVRCTQRSKHTLSCAAGLQCLKAGIWHMSHVYHMDLHLPCMA